MKPILIAVIAMMFATSARAEERAAPAPAKSGWSDFFKNLKSALAQSAVSGQQKKGRNAGAVASVRGEGQDKKINADPNEPALKGSAKAARAKKARILNDKFLSCVELVTGGKPEEGLKELEAFKAGNPKHMVEDVDKAIEGAKAMIAEKNAVPAAKP